MSQIPENLKYTKDHEWLMLESEGIALIGITDYAQESLGDITFIEMPAAGDHFSAGDAFGVVDSVKAASDLYMPIDGEVIAVNTALEAEPEKVNNDPYSGGWLIKIKLKEEKQIEDLLSAAAYHKLLQV